MIHGLRRLPPVPAAVRRRPTHAPDLPRVAERSARHRARGRRGARWAELTARLAGHGVVAEPAAGTIDLRTTAGLQTALARLGYDVGAIDGIPGPKTRVGVTAFQRDHALVVDGIYGPKTRAAFEAALTRELATS